jgi:hypothetical protein
MAQRLGHGAQHRRPGFPGLAGIAVTDEPTHGSERLLELHGRHLSATIPPLRPDLRAKRAVSPNVINRNHQVHG